MKDVLLGEVPFYWRSKAAPGEDGSGIPQLLPFSFTFDAATQLLKQRREERVLTTLNHVYRMDSNVGYLQEGHSLAEPYGNDFLEFFDSVIERQQPGQEVAEIGCGGVYLLDRVRSRGHHVVGIDPSPITLRAGQAAGIEIIQDFFPSDQISRTFDLMLHYDVLEHTEDPVQFMFAHRQLLRTGGSVVLAVPDCTQQILNGDISMMLHEHLNYFDRESLQLVLKAAGLQPVRIEKSGHGDVLYAHAKLGQLPSSDPAVRTTAKFDMFAERVGSIQQVLHQIFEGATLQNEVIGCYVPLRALPYLGKAIHEGLRIRFFDDDPGLHGRYFDGVDIPVESFDQLVRNPPTSLVIFSRAFGAAIKARVTSAIGKRMRVLTIDELAHH
jgi:2-polyprenyl-3-methyl-5-hydroxy-6-metoxy-1,4-benzoquinol methylase